jgi:hypothetical protein
MEGCKEGEWDLAGVVGDWGGHDSRPRGFSERNDLDLALGPFDWVGDLKNENHKRIKEFEIKCWGLDLTGASGEFWLPMRMKISRDIDIAVREQNCSAEEAMSELHFKLTRRDVADFLTWFFDSFHPTFIPETHSSEDFPEYRSASEVMEVAHLRLAGDIPARFFALSDDWSKTPLCVEECHPIDGHPSFFYVRQRYGGPAFDFILRLEAGSGVDEQVYAGWLMDYPYYYRQIGSSESLERPRRMTEAYKMSKAWIRRRQLAV